MVHLHISTVFVPSCETVTDALSRRDIRAFLTDFPAAVTRSSMPLPDYLANKMSSL